MKLIAHRGWSAGAGENTLAAFRRAAAEPGVSGVEFDVRRAADGTLVVAHDPPDAGAPTLEAVAALLARSKLDAYVELKEAGLTTDVARTLSEGGLGDRAVIFGPVELMEPMERPRRVRLGIIVEYPWRISRLATAFAPDVILLGWDDRTWTRLAFQAWWSVFSLRRTGRRHSAPIVVGVARRARDLRWLGRQGIDAAVADLAEI
ncbi:glycerophosphodiester phosphodiesterase [uncultured Jannaschia sp.]|uniref:glycerophosphodiester phosphodiesterase n=1 Tax=uncultured Jannaschia sp. TaxID=293347 RepID=UPI0026374F0F|nr:glycerophosphodiester phosphodiesterase [uncultured Jannaschia sp.]